MTRWSGAIRAGAAALAALAALVLVGAASGAGAARLVEGVSLDGVAIGMTRAQATRLVGPPLSCKKISQFDLPHAYGCTWKRPWGTFSAQLTVKGSRIVYLTTLGPFRAANGIGSGSRERAVVRAYGKDYARSSPIATGSAPTGRLVRKVGGEYRETAFAFIGGKLAGVQLIRTYVPQVRVALSSTDVLRGGDALTVRLTGLPPGVGVAVGFRLQRPPLVPVLLDHAGRATADADGTAVVTVPMDERFVAEVADTVDRGTAQLALEETWSAPVGGRSESIAVGSIEVELPAPPVIAAVEGAQVDTASGSFSLVIDGLSPYESRNLVVHLDDADCGRGYDPPGPVSPAFPTLDASGRTVVTVAADTSELLFRSIADCLRVGQQRELHVSLGKTVLVDEAEQSLRFVPFASAALTFVRTL